MTRRFVNSYFSQIPELAEDLAKRDTLRAKFLKDHPNGIEGINSEPEAIANEISAADEDGDPVFYSYFKERMLLTNLMSHLYKKDPEKYKGDPVLVFEHFGRAALNGRLLDLARSIDDALGKGTFKKLGEVF